MTNRTAPNPYLHLAARSRRPLGGAAVACSLALTALTLFMPRVASAQEWLKDRRYQEGAGIRAGDLEIHPGIGGEIGYDSNYFLRTGKLDPRFANGAPTNPPVEAGVIRITPSVTIGTLTRQRLEGGAVEPAAVNFRAGVAATYHEFIGPQQLRDQRNVSGNAFARMDIFQARPLGFGVFANYQRLIQPAVVADPNRSFNRSDASVGAEVIAIPGGGTLDLRAGYQFFGAFFEDSNGVPFTNVTHEISERNRWRFRPRTALFHDTSLRFISYPNASRALNYLNDSTPIRTRLGLTGLVTDRFGMLLAAGYGATFFKNGAAPSTTQYDSVNGQAEGTFYLSKGAGADEPGQATLLLSTVSLGFVRDFQNSLLGNYFDSNKGYAKVVYFFGGRMLLQLNGYFEALGYPQPFLNGPAGPVPVNGANGAPTGAFTNFHVGGTFFAEYRFTDSFGINTTIDYQQMISDVALQSGGVPVAPPPGTPPAADLYDLSWSRFQAFLGVRFFF